MGCDIHLHIEIKINGTWHHYGAPNVSRRTKLFEKMAGVRGSVTNAIVPPKGTPDDISGITRMDVDRFKIGGHSHSWFTCEEIGKLEDWLNEQGGFAREMDLEHHILHTYLFGNSFAGFRKYPSDYKDSPIEDVRFVFFFDN